MTGVQTCALPILQLGVQQLGVQLVGIVATWVFAFAGTLVLLKVVDALVGLRVNAEEEFLGLDVSQHSETAYAFESGYGGLSGMSEGFVRREPAVLEPAPGVAGTRAP